MLNSGPIGKPRPTVTLYMALLLERKEYRPTSSSKSVCGVELDDTDINSIKSKLGPGGIDSPVRGWLIHGTNWMRRLLS